MEYGYIYIRTHQSYKKHDCCKLGKTNNIPDRDSQYATGEIERGLFECVFELPLDKIGYVEKSLQNEFIKYNHRENGGREFYKLIIIFLIESYLKLINIKYKKLSNDEIKKLLRCHRVKERYKSFSKNIIIFNRNIKKTIIPVKLIPRDYQQNIISKAVKYFSQKNQGLLVLTCGVGKTLISLWIAKELKQKRIIIGVPNILLLEQWEKSFTIVFPNTPYFIMKKGENNETFKNFLENNKSECIVITTYSSSIKVSTVATSINYIFDMKINDEVHHLTCANLKLNKETTKNYIKMLDIPSIKQISLTATLKNIDSINCEDKSIISNNNIDYFGEIIHRMCLFEAIKENIICDYVIQTIVTNEEELNDKMSKFNIYEENDKRLFLSAYASLKSICEGHSHHLLIYANSKENSNKIIDFINSLLEKNYFNIPELYFKVYNSSIKEKIQTDIINNFENSKYGIISCVYCLGEGWDFPLLDAVIFAENMTSNIRILQSALRGSRKDKNNINKITKIILPILNQGNWLENTDNPDLKKVKEIIFQMSIEDESIIQKIKVFRLNIVENKKIVNNDGKVSIIDRDCDIHSFGEYDEELTKKLKLKTINRSCIGMTYQKAKKIIEDKNILSKQSYYDLCDKDIRLSKEPDIDFKGTFINWIDYLNIKRIYYNLKECKIKINEYNLLYPDMKKDYLDLSKICNKLCEIDVLFPPNGLWAEYYNVKSLNEIITLIIKKNMKGIII
jgi:superfamily II DNA or RNA helicase